ncbi:hypothetical protein BTVI_06369 [Pitangus sulphuratus]|nr:hypothetical protein BTVI_06369 [Pitangus sulphuratus]
MSNLTLPWCSLRPFPPLAFPGGVEASRQNLSMALLRSGATACGSPGTRGTVVPVHRQGYFGCAVQLLNSKEFVADPGVRAPAKDVLQQNLEL